MHNISSKIRSSNIGRTIKILLLLQVVSSVVFTSSLMDEMSHSALATDGNVCGPSATAGEKCIMEGNRRGTCPGPNTMCVAAPELPTVMLPLFLLVVGSSFCYIRRRSVQACRVA